MKSLTICVVACLGVSVVVPSGLVAQGLGGAARKEQARRMRSAAGVEVPVVGNEELLSQDQRNGTFSTPEASSEQTGAAETARTAPAPPSFVRAPSLGVGRPDPAPATPAAEPPSEMDQLKAKAEKWRVRYHEARRSVDLLQREVADLEQKSRRTVVVGTYGCGPRNPNIRHEAEVVQDRLPQARKDLARAKQELAAIEDGARRDGVGSGQLY